jgi:hypothetical protein
MSYSRLADLVLFAHALVPLFIVGGLVAIALGAWRGWRWIRNRRFRALHAGLMGVVLAQALLGRLCPLTIWEHELRVRAGQTNADEPEGFIAYWVSHLLYIAAPPTFFIALYALVMALIVIAWRLVPPSPRS